MTDELASLWREVEFARASVDAAMKQYNTAADRLRAAYEAAAPSGSDTIELMPLGEAAKVVGVSKSQMRRLAADHPYGSDDGFGVRQGARWWIAVVPFRAFVDKRRRARAI